MYLEDTEKFIIFGIWCMSILAVFGIGGAKAGFTVLVISFLLLAIYLFHVISKQNEERRVIELKIAKENKERERQEKEATQKEEDNLREISSVLGCNKTTAILFQRSNGEFNDGHFYITSDKINEFAQDIKERMNEITDDSISRWNYGMYVNYPERSYSGSSADSEEISSGACESCHDYSSSLHTCPNCGRQVCSTCHESPLGYCRRCY